MRPMANLQQKLGPYSYSHKALNSANMNKLFKVDSFLESKASTMILALSIKHNLAHASMHIWELINGIVLSHQGCGNVVQRNRKLTQLIIMMGRKKWN